MKKRVKITTMGWILDILFPCYCKGCGKIGSSFCRCCIFNNLAENPPIFALFDVDFRLIFTCGSRVFVLKKLILDYKFRARRHYSKDLANYLFLAISQTFPKFFENRGEMVIVPLPTIRKHIRERGFDHIGRLAQDFSAISGIPVVSLLSRVNSAVQVGSSAKKRLEQAKGAYIINSKVDFNPESHFILLDDVWTTGASMRAAKGVLEAKLIEMGVSREKIKISAVLLSKNSGDKF